MNSRPAEQLENSVPQQKVGNSTNKKARKGRNQYSMSAKSEESPRRR